MLLGSLPPSMVMRVHPLPRFSAMRART
jgi:hypothetical protein